MKKLFFVAGGTSRDDSAALNYQVGLVMEVVQMLGQIIWRGS
jgi:hypothetical protein